MLDWGSEVVSLEMDDMEVALRREEVDHKIKHRHCTGFKIGISEATGGGAWGLQTFFFRES